MSTLVHRLWPGSYREAPAMFKRGNVYFLLTSGATGWDPNQAKYATATSIAGTWSGLSNVGNSTTYDSQLAYVLPIEGSSATSYLYMGDRWAGAWGGPVNDSQYVWLPLTFPSSTSMSWYSEIIIDTERGTITGGSTTSYQITARHSGKCLDVYKASTANGALIQQWDYVGGTPPHKLRSAR